MSGANDENAGLREQVEQLKRRVAELERSEAISRKTLEASTDVIFRLGLDAVCTYVSRAIVDVLGYQPEEHVGRSGFALLHPDDQDLPRALHEHLSVTRADESSDRVGPFLSRLRHKQGHYVWAECMLALLRDPDTGEVQEFVLSARDVDARVEVEQALRVSEKRFQTLVDSMQVGLVIQGPRSEMLLFNQTALSMLGLTAEQISGRDSFDPRWGVIHEDGSPFPGEEHPVVVAIKTGKTVRDVVMGVYHPATDSRVWLLVAAAPQFDAEGRAIQTVCTFTDITAQKHAEALIREQKDLLERLSSPIIPIADGVVVLTLIGQFDAQRTDRVLESVLTGVGSHRARVVILDITGVSAADAAFAAALMRITRAVRLLGAELVVTGVSAQIARTLVELGVELTGLITRGTLQDGVAYALRR